MDEATLISIVLGVTTLTGAIVTAFWVAFTIWTYNDMKARSRDPLAKIAACLLVAVLSVFGLIIYVMLRPRETLSDAYERSLEEEALLQEIEEKRGACDATVAAGARDGVAVRATGSNSREPR